MTRVNRLSVTVTYKVGLGNVDIPENVFEQLVEAHRKGDSIEGAQSKYPEASDWLSNNISEKDCFDWETEIDDISTQ